MSYKYEDIFISFAENKYKQKAKQHIMKTVRYGVEAALYGTLQPWSLVLSDIESLSNVNLLKSEVKLNIGA